MARTISEIWNNPPENIFSHLETCLKIPRNQAVSFKETIVFFRADDIAVPSENFSKLISLFSHYKMPLSLAVVPAWLTHQRWKQIKNFTDVFSSLWCWHQHGWRHVNHSLKGKKYEFGQHRSILQIQDDLKNGMNRLRKIMGENFYPVFTPPWNRCDENTLNQLKRLGYKAVSRNSGSKLINNEQISEYNVNVDLHTRKEKDSKTGWNNLFGELRHAVAGGLCGIMIHHQLMNDYAFDFIKYLFQAIENQPGLKVDHLKGLADNDSARNNFCVNYESK